MSAPKFWVDQVVRVWRTGRLATVKSLDYDSAEIEYASGFREVCDLKELES